MEDKIDTITENKKSSEECSDQNDSSGDKTNKKTRKPAKGMKPCSRDGCPHLAKKEYCFRHSYLGKEHPCGYDDGTGPCQVMTQSEQCRKHNFDNRRKCGRATCKRYTRLPNAFCYYHKADAKQAGDV